MNEPQVKAVPNQYGGWEAHFTKCDRSGWDQVRENGEIRLFDTDTDAKLAAYEAQNAYHFGRGILRSGDTVKATKIAAEKLFMGGGRVVEVARR